MKRTLATISLLCLGAVALTGCSSDTNAKGGEKTTSTSAPSSTETSTSGGSELTQLIPVEFSETTRSERSIDIEQELPILVEAEANTGVLIFGGSGSCPPEVLSVDYNESSSTLQVSWAPFADATAVCTMDFVQYESTITAPETVDLSTAKTEFTVSAG